jgi:outer membrane protein assembly factor BamB
MVSKSSHSPQRNRDHRRTVAVELLVILCLVTIVLIPVVVMGGPEMGPHGLTRIDLTTHPQGPIPHGQSAITALTVSPDGVVYGGTSAERGKSSYLFRTDGERLQDVWSLANLLPGEERVVNALVVAEDGKVYGGTTNFCEEDEVPDTYRGGHAFRLDPSTGEITDLGIPVPGQGINYLTIDRTRRTIYGLTYPRGHLLVWDLRTGRIEDKEATVPPPRPVKEPRDTVYIRYLPRALALDGDGNVYGTRESGLMWRFTPAKRIIDPLEAKIPCTKGMDEDWLYNHVADSFCLGSDGLIYGGTTSDGYLFVFDPKNGTVTNLGKPIRQSRIRSVVQGADGKIYALAGEENGVAHLVTYDPQTRGMADLGAIGPSVWSWLVYRAGTMIAHPSGKILIGEAERISALVIYDPMKATEKKTVE